MLGPLLFILYTSEMFVLVENILYAYADDSTLLAVVRKPADRPAVACSLYRDLAGIQEWCNHWCMIVNCNKTKALVVSRSIIVDTPHGDLVLSGVSICTCPNLYILGVNYDSKLTFKDHIHVIVSHVSKNFYCKVGETCFCGFLCIASFLLCICSLDPCVIFSSLGVCS